VFWFLKHQLSFFFHNTQYRLGITGIKQKIKMNAGFYAWWANGNECSVFNAGFYAHTGYWESLLTGLYPTLRYTIFSILLLLSPSYV
jgi:hypothetical protein